MKRYALYLLVFVAMALFPVSCRHDGREESGPEGESADSLVIVRGGESAFRIIASSGNANASGLASFIKALTGVAIPTALPAAAANDYEILVGYSPREESIRAYKELEGTFGYIVRVDGKKLVIAGSDDTWVALGLYALVSKLSASSGSELVNGMSILKSLSLTETSSDPQLIARLIKGRYDFSLQLKYVMSCPPAGTVYVAQGAASDGEHFYFVMRTSDDSKSIAYKYDMRTQELIASSAEFNGGHCNDATFDVAGGRFIVAHGQSEGKILTPIDAATMTVQPNITISVGSGAITYSPARNGYAISQGGSSFYVTDSNFKVKVKKTRTDKTGYTAQGMGSDESYVYFPMSGSKDNILVVYDWEGTYVTTLTVPTTTESESMFYAAGRYYVNFYAGSSKGAMLYEIVPVHTFKYPNN